METHGVGEGSGAGRGPRRERVGSLRWSGAVSTGGGRTGAAVAKRGHAPGRDGGHTWLRTVGRRFRGCRGAEGRRSEAETQPGR